MIIANFFKKLVLTFTFSVFVVVATFAQAGVDPTPPGSSEVPIDGGAFGLLVIGAVYGAKKIYDQRKPR